AAQPRTSRSKARGGGRRLLVLSPRLLIASMPDVFTQLLEGDVHLLFSGRSTDQLRVPNELASHPNANIVSLPLARGLPTQDVDRVGRALGDGLRFLDESLADASWARARALRRFFKLAGHPEWKQAPATYEGLALPHHVLGRIDEALRRAESFAPPPTDLEEAVAELGVDAVCSSPGARSAAPGRVQSRTAADSGSRRSCWSGAGTTSRARPCSTSPPTVFWSGTRSRRERRSSCTGSRPSASRW